MALDAVVLQKDLLAFNMKELYGMGAAGPAAWSSYDFAGGGEQPQEVKLIKQAKEEEAADVLRGVINWETAACCSSSVDVAGSFKVWEEEGGDGRAPADPTSGGQESGAGAGGRRKWRRVRKLKNKEEVESQRMTHIAVERNRRKQMNEYLAVLRSLMPPSFVQRVDQASIVGGAINFVKELEQLVQSLEALKRIKRRRTNVASLFADFFEHPQYSSSSTATGRTAGVNSSSSTASTTSAEAGLAVADIEVSVVDGHANIKIFSRWRPRQLLKLVVALQSLHLTTLHLNVTTVDQMVLYCFNLKVEEGCQFTSVDVIATAVHQIIARIEEEEVAHLL